MGRLQVKRDCGPGLTPISHADLVLFRPRTLPVDGIAAIRRAGIHRNPIRDHKGREEAHPELSDEHVRGFFVGGLEAFSLRPGPSAPRCWPSR